MSQTLQDKLIINQSIWERIMNERTNQIIEETGKRIHTEYTTNCHTIEHDTLVVIKEYVKCVISECKNELVRGELQGFEEDGPHFKCWNDMKIRAEWVLQTLNDISPE